MFANFLEGESNAFTENSVILMLLVDENGVAISSNMTPADLFGNECQEIIGKSIFDLLPKRIAEDYSKDLKNVFETGSSIFCERLLSIEGREIWIHIELTPLKNNEGKVGAVVGMTRKSTVSRQ